MAGSFVSPSTKRPYARSGCRNSWMPVGVPAKNGFKKTNFSILNCLIWFANRQVEQGWQNSEILKSKWQRKTTLMISNDNSYKVNQLSGKLKFLMIFGLHSISITWPSEIVFLIYRIFTIQIQGIPNCNCCHVILNFSCFLWLCPINFSIQN